ncbi:hypothetical protein WA026_016808 [Henosepilachna vigintioctopunctata]|uniref:C2H2-type domain-containing protein n=1 Tax=Henosepilachna vigintioctopunctata TaxID=420089 RepID=A0AAW1V188_9CUCU
MFASKSKSNSCAVPDCTTKELTNSSRIGNDICATPLTKNSGKNSKIANSAEYTRYRYAASKEIASKPKVTLRCVVPGCTSGGKSNSPEKWYVLPRLEVSGGKDSLNSQSLGAVYSKLNIQSKYLGKSIQICSKHFPLKDLQALNVSLESHTEDCEDRVQHINKVKLRSSGETTLKTDNRIKINLRREDLSVGQPALNLTQMKCSDGNVHLMCSPSKPKTRQNIPIVYNGVPEQNSSRSPQLTGKPHGQMNLTINKDLRAKMESHRVFTNNIHNVSPVSKRKPTNTNVIQYKYVSADGEVIDVTVDKNDVHSKNRFHPEETTPCKNEFQFVDIHSIINSSTTCNESVEEKNSRIFAENSKRDDSVNLRKVHTKDVGVQTNDNYDFNEMLGFFRKHVLKFPFSYNNEMFAIENISLFFQPVKFPDKAPIIVQVREHKLRASCGKFLKYLNYNLRQKSGKSPKQLPLTYRIVNGFYEASSENGDLGDTESVNLGNEVMYSEFINTNEDESFQTVSNEDNNKSGLTANSDKSESSFNNFDKTIHGINSVGTVVPNINDLYQTDLTNPLKNREAIKNNMFNSSFKIVENAHNCVIPNSKSLQITDHTSSITDDDQTKLPELPKIKVVNIANLKSMKEKNETQEHNDDKTISCISKRIRIEEEKSSLRRSNRKRKNINFAKIMKNSLSENYGNVPLNKNSINNKFSKCSLKKKVTVNCDINKKRKKCDENISSKSVDDAGNKKGKYGEMIEELEKFLELTLEQPSEDIVDIPLDDSYNLDCGFLVSSSCSVNNNDKSLSLLRENYTKSPDRKKTLKKIIGKNSNTKKLTKKTGSVKHKYHSITKYDNHSTKVTSMLTRSKTVKNLLQNKQRSKMIKLKLKNDKKNSKYNKKSIATSKKSSKNELAKKIKSIGCINASLDQELNLKNFNAFCCNCNKIFDRRTLACHWKMCLKKTMCDHCGLMIHNRVMWRHLQLCVHSKCEECGLTFPDILLLKEHLLTLKDCFLCENCRVIVVGSDIDKHLKKCKLPDRTSNLPVKYLSYIYSNNSKRYCKLCLQSFESFLKFTKHVYLSHRNASTKILLTMKRKILKKYLKKRSKPNEYKCSFCEHISKNMQEKIDHYEACLKRIAENCTVETEEQIH